MTNHVQNVLKNIIILNKKKKKPRLELGFYFTKIIKTVSMRAAIKNKGKTMNKNISSVRKKSILNFFFLNIKLKTAKPRIVPEDRANNIAGISNIPCGIIERKTNKILDLSMATRITKPIIKAFTKRMR